MFGLSGQELLVIVILALIILGPKKLPEVAKTIGKGYQELKKAVDGVRGSVNVGDAFSEMMRGDSDRSTDTDREKKQAGRDDDRERKG